MSNKVGRNEPCPCGSGLKFKKCCLGKSPAAQVSNQARAYEKRGKPSTFASVCALYQRLMELRHR